MVTRPFVDVPLGGWQLLAQRCLATLLLADLSFRLVETPIRGGALAPALRILGAAAGRMAMWRGAAHNTLGVYH